jgi:hypothetical protein
MRAPRPRRATPQPARAQVPGGRHPLGTGGGWRPVPLIVVVVGLVPTLSACAGAAARVQLPAKPVVTSASVIAPAVLTQREQVVTALTGYVTAVAQGERSRSISAARQLLRPCLAAGRISGLVQAMSTIWAKGESFYGEDVLHVSSVMIAGDRAFVHDCDDTAGLGLMNVATGEIVPGSPGVPRDNLVTRLDLVGGHWLVQFQLVEDVPCTP